MSVKNDYIDEDQVDEKTHDIKSFLFLIKLIGCHKFHFIFAVFIMTIAIVMLTFSSRVMGMIVDALEESNYYNAAQLGVAVIALELLGILLLWRGRKRLSLVASKIILDVRKKIFKHINKLPIAYYDKQPQGRTITRMTSDVEGVEEFFVSTLGRFFNSIISFVIVVCAMLLTDYRIGIALTLSAMPAIVAIIISRKKIRRITRNISKKNSAVNSKLAENINGIDVIRSFGIESWAKEQYEERLDGHLNSLLKANKLYVILRPLIHFLCNLPLMVLLVVGGLMVSTGRVELGILVAFIRYCERFSFPISHLAREMHIIQQAFTSFERVRSFLEAVDEDELFSGDGLVDLKTIDGNIEFKNVVMGYAEDKIILNDISFKIAKGERVGLVGETGSGKSTTVSLLSRLYDYQKGEIYIDGISLKEIKRSCLRSRIGFVSQEVAIFKGTLLENLSCGGSYSYFEVNEACIKTGLLIVMKNRNLTLKSKILDYGNNLSGGERQLVSLTRVLLSNPDILILDEATASIDPDFERIIHKAVDIVMDNRTCLMIAHRLDTLQSVDKILVFKNGKLVEEGGHDLLVEKRGYFYQLNNQQSLSIV